MKELSTQERIERAISGDQAAIERLLLDRAKQKIRESLQSASRYLSR